MSFSALIRSGCSSRLFQRIPPMTTMGMFDVPKAGLKAPVDYSWVEFPEKNKLKFIDKVPTYPPGVRTPKFQKSLIYMRGPELVHNKLIHKQYGIVAMGPGRMRYGHFEMIRLTMGKKMDQKNQFAVWRIDPPWQALTKIGQGKRHGGGKSSIDHYVTPIRQGRIIIEMGGRCSFDEVSRLLGDIAHKLPFPAKAISHESLEAMEEKKRWEKENNLNPYTFKYIVQNNMGGSHSWIRPYDRLWFNEHI